MKTKFYTYDAWVKEFQPMQNHLNVFPNSLGFETYGNEDDYVSQQDNHNVWTEVDGEDGTYIIAGYHYVNRLQYFITSKAWDNELTEVPTWCYRNCDCRDRANDALMEAEEIDPTMLDYDPDCTLGCEEGFLDIPVDTVEDLKAIYGEDADIYAD